MISQTVEWYYCERCKKDVKTELKVTITCIDEYDHWVTVEVCAICVECKGTITCASGRVELV